MHLVCILYALVSRAGRSRVRHNNDDVREDRGHRVPISEHCVFASRASSLAVRTGEIKISAFTTTRQRDAL
jgi:hypothetical protein